MSFPARGAFLPLFGSALGLLFLSVAWFGWVQISDLTNSRSGNTLVDERYSRSQPSFIDEKGIKEHKTRVPLVHDFGVVNSRAKLEHVFNIHNPTNRLLMIDRVASSCGCAVATLSALTIAPGRAIVATVNYTAPATAGVDARNVEVLFRGEDVPLRLTVRAFVRVPLHLSATELKLADGPASRHAIIVENNSSTDWDSVRVGLFLTSDWPLLGLDMYF